MRQVKMITIVAAAMALTVGCEEVEPTFDSQLEEAVVDLEDELNAEGHSMSGEPVEADRPVNQGTTDPVVEDGLSRREIMRAVSLLASRESCEIGGIIAGRYRGWDSSTETNLDIELVDSDASDGEFRIKGYNFNGDRLAVGQGQFWNEGRGGDFSGTYETGGGGTGLLGGEFFPSGVVFDDLGAFMGDWSSIDTDIVQFEGNIAGVWHRLPSQSGGIIVGYWSDCEDQDRDEPAPIPA